MIFCVERGAALERQRTLLIFYDNYFTILFLYVFDDTEKNRLAEADFFSLYEKGSPSTEHK